MKHDNYTLSFIWYVIIDHMPVGFIQNIFVFMAQTFIEIELYRSPNDCKMKKKKVKT